MSRFDSTSFLDQVKLLGAIPNGRFEDDEILAIASDQLNSVVVPLILLQKEEYYLTPEDQAITANQAAYPIPYRAMGLSLREVKLVKSNEVRDLPRIDPTEVKTGATGEPWAFYLQGTDVILYPTPATTQNTLRLSYFLTPSAFVPLAEVGLITDIDRATGIVTAAIPSTWATSSTYDLVSSKNGHQSKATGLVASAITATTDITFIAADIPASIVIGDYVCLEGESPYLQCPDICFRYIVQLTINDLLASMEAQAALQAGMALATKFEGLMISNLQNRVAGAPRRLRITL